MACKCGQKQLGNSGQGSRWFLGRIPLGGSKEKNDDAIKRMIDKGLEGTSVTVVLIGKETSDRKWVRYEIKESYKKGNGLLGVYIGCITPF